MTGYNKNVCFFVVVFFCKKTNIYLHITGNKFLNNPILYIYLYIIFQVYITLHLN